MPTLLELVMELFETVMRTVLEDWWGWIGMGQRGPKSSGGSNLKCVHISTSVSRRYKGLEIKIIKVE